MRRLRLSFYSKGLMDRVIFASWSVLFGLSLSRSGLNLLRWKKKDGNFRIWQHAVWCEIKFAMLIVSSAQCPKAKLLLSVFWPCSGDLLFYIWERERERERYHCVGIILHTPLGSKTECSDLFFFFLFRALLTAGRFVSSENRNPDTARHATRTRVHARVNQRENTLVGGERTSIRLFRWSPFFPWQSMRWLLGLKKTTTTTSICPIASLFSRCTVLFRFCSLKTQREYVRPGHRKS